MQRNGLAGFTILQFTGLREKSSCGLARFYSGACCLRTLLCYCKDVLPLKNP